MNTKNRLLGVVAMSAGMLGLVPSLASAFHGSLVNCSAFTPIVIEIPVKPGLTCTPTLNKLTVNVNAKTSGQIGGCVGNAAAPWSDWATAKWGSKASATDVASISKADISIKVVDFGLCDFNGSPQTSGAYGAGKFQFYDSLGNKIKTGKGAFFAKLKSTPSGAAYATGLVTKGLGLGAVFEASGLNVDLTDSAPDRNGPIACCNVIGCPNGCNPTTIIIVKTDASSSLKIRIPDNVDCTGGGQPLSCCTGVGAGTCGTGT